MNVIDLHEATWQRLQARRAQLPHALLLAGARGLGKLALARRFAAALLCEQPDARGDACGACPSCNWLGQGNHPDFRLLQPEALAEAEPGEGEKKASQQITIDQVRGLDDFLHVGTHRLGLRVVLVHPAEAMNRSTANALLKTLEEPSPDTLFLLVSNEPDRLLPTVRSRCQTLSVPAPETSLAIRWLEASGVEQAARWLPLAGGAPLLAAELATPASRALLDAVVGELGKGPALEPLSAAAALDKAVKAEKGGTPMKRLVEWVQKWLHDLLLAASAASPRYFTGETERLHRIAAATDTVRLLALAREALQYRAQAEHPLNSRLFLESICMAYADLFVRE